MILKILDKFLSFVGQYLIMLRRVLTIPQKWKVFRQQYFREVEYLGISSLGIVAFISIFVGAVVALQMSLNIAGSAYIPKYYISYATRESVILEFSPTIMSIILVGKVGSYIASSIGTMRVTEQIDALEVMGVNSLNYLVLPKIAAAMSFFPLLIMTSMFLAIIGGWVAAVGTGVCTTPEYVHGIQMPMDIFNVYYALFKSMVFAFVIATLPAFFGYYIKGGGALEVGKASTLAVVWSSIVVIILNYLITQVVLM